jgi:hypothetical protein
MNVDLEIAKRKGYRIDDNPYLDKEALAIAVPKYQSDPALILDLVKELLSAEWKLSKEGKLYIWYKGYNKCWNKDFGTGTCLAWLEEFEELRK